MRGDDGIARAAAALVAQLSEDAEAETAEVEALARRKRDLQVRARARARSAVPQVEQRPNFVVLDDIDEPTDSETPERPGLAALLRRAVQSAAAVAGIPSGSETGAERTAGVCELCMGVKHGPVRDGSGRVVGWAYCPQCRGTGSAPLALR